MKELDRENPFPTPRSVRLDKWSQRFGASSGLVRRRHAIDHYGTSYGHDSDVQAW